MARFHTQKSGTLQTAYTSGEINSRYKTITMHNGTATTVLAVNSANTYGTDNMPIVAYSYHPVLQKTNLRSSLGHFGSQTSHVLFTSSGLVDATGSTWTASNASAITYPKDTTLKFLYSMYVTTADYFTRSEKFVFYQQPCEFCIIFKPTNITTNTCTLFSLTVSSSQRAHCAMIGGNYCEWWATSSSGKLELFRQAVTPNTVHKAQIRFKGSTWHFYIDDTKVGTYDYTLPNGTYTVCLGGDSLHSSYTKNIYYFSLVDGYSYIPSNNAVPAVTDIINKTSFSSNIYNNGTSLLFSCD